MLNLSRRSCLALTAAVPVWAARKGYRVAVMGHTGRGNYGHGLDTVWRAVPRMEVVAVADANDAGRAAAVKRLGAPRAYGDYREMLRAEKPDIVAVTPRWMDQRVEMVTAAAEAGAHIYMEKPFALTLADADRMVAAVVKNKVKLQIAHQMRRSPFALQAKAWIEAGEIGEVQEVRTRGKEDRRAGGEDMMVLGSHLCDMLRFFLGNPQWTVAHVTSGGREIGSGDVKQASEPIGPVAGTEISAMFAFAGGVHGYFASRAVAATHELRFGTWIYGSKGVIFLPNAIYPAGGLHILRSPAWLPDGKTSWEAWAGPAEVAARPQVANALMVEDLVRAIEQGGQPCCNEEDGRWTIEMVHSVYEAQRTGGRVTLPLRERTHPLAASQVRNALPSLIK